MSDCNSTDWFWDGDLDERSSPGLSKASSLRGSQTYRPSPEHTSTDQPACSLESRRSPGESRFLSADYPDLRFLIKQVSLVRMRQQAGRSPSCQQAAGEARIQL